MSDSSRARVRDALWRWLDPPEGWSLRWEDRRSGQPVGELRVSLLRGSRQVELWLRDAKPGALWASDGVQVTCRKPEGLEEDAALRTLFNRLGRRFGGTAPSAGELLGALAQQRSPGDSQLEEWMYHRVEHTTHGPRGFMRLGFRCNQDCFICPQSRDWPNMDEATVLGWLDDMAAEGVQRLTLSGGEPTIFSFLPKVIARARHEHGMRIHVQTNAVRFAKPGYVEKLIDAGLEFAFISLHSADAEISDALTRAPRTHAKTVAGIQNALRAGLWVGLNCCVETHNVAGLEAHARFVVSQFVEPFADNPVGLVEYSQPGAYYDDARMLQSMAPLEDVATSLLPALRILRAAGVAVDCTGTCGFPVCTLREEPTLAPWRRAERLDAHDRSARRYPAECEPCAAREYCVGLRHDYQRAHGARGVVPYPALPDIEEHVDVEPR